jgi:hypothetical protein
MLLSVSDKVRLTSPSFQEDVFFVSNAVYNSLAKHIRNLCVSPKKCCRMWVLLDMLMLPVSYSFFDLVKSFSVSAEALASSLRLCRIIMEDSHYCYPP